MKIILNRTGALGDALCAVPILRRLRAENPGALIQMRTVNPLAFQDSPYLGGAYNGEEVKEIELDLAYERRPGMHVVDAYMLEAFGDTGDGHDKALCLRRERRWRDAQGSILIHAAASWPNRTFSRRFWDNLAIILRQGGHPVIFIGSGQDYGGPYGVGCDSAVRQLSLHETAALIADARLLIGCDSALLHVGGTTDTAMVGLYTCAKAAYRMPYRHGHIGWNMIGLDAPIDCGGCLERLPAPNTNYNCARGDNACVEVISLQSVVAAVHSLLADQPPAQP